MKTLLVFVQDETGSMMSRRDTTISAFNEYFQTLKSGQDIGEVEVHAWQFSEVSGEERVRTLHKGSLQNVPELDEKRYRPRGVTPLYDAVGTAISQAEGITGIDRYLFIIQTDGLENASKDFSREQVARMVEAKEADDKWTLVFMGAGIQNWIQEAGQMGAAVGSTTSYVGDPASTRAAYHYAAADTVTLLASAQTSNKTLASEVEQKIRKEEGGTQSSSGGNSPQQSS